MPNVLNMSDLQSADFDVGTATNLLLENFTPGRFEPVHYVNYSDTRDECFRFNYKKRAKYALKLPEHDREIFLPNAESVSHVLTNSGRPNISKWSVYDFFNARRRGGNGLESKLGGAVIRKL